MGLWESPRQLGPRRLLRPSARARERGQQVQNWGSTLPARQAQAPGGAPAGPPQHPGGPSGVRWRPGLRGPSRGFQGSPETSSGLEAAFQAPDSPPGRPQNLPEPGASPAHPGQPAGGRPGAAQGGSPEQLPAGAAARSRTLLSWVPKSRFQISGGIPSEPRRYVQPKPPSPSPLQPPQRLREWSPCLPTKAPMPPRAASTSPS